MKKGMIKRLLAVVLVAVMATSLIPVMGTVTNGAVGQVEAKAAEIGSIELENLSAGTNIKSTTARSPLSSLTISGGVYGIDYVFNESEIHLLTNKKIAIDGSNSDHLTWLYIISDNQMDSQSVEIKNLSCGYIYIDHEKVTDGTSYLPSENDGKISNLNLDINNVSCMYCYIGSLNNNVCFNNSNNFSDVICFCNNSCVSGTFSCGGITARDVQIEDASITSEGTMQGNNVTINSGSIELATSIKAEQLVINNGTIRVAGQYNAPAGNYSLNADTFIMNGGIVNVLSFYCKKVYFNGGCFNGALNINMNPSNIEFGNASVILSPYNQWGYKYPYDAGDVVFNGKQLVKIAHGNSKSISYRKQGTSTWTNLEFDEYNDSKYVYLWLAKDTYDFMVGEDEIKAVDITLDPYIYLCKHVVSKSIDLSALDNNAVYLYQEYYRVGDTKYYAENSYDEYVLSGSIGNIFIEDECIVHLNNVNSNISVETEKEVTLYLDIETKNNINDITTFETGNLVIDGYGELLSSRIGNENDAGTIIIKNGKISVTSNSTTNNTYCIGSTEGSVNVNIWGGDINVDSSNTSRTVGIGSYSGKGSIRITGGNISVSRGRQAGYGSAIGGKEADIYISGGSIYALGRPTNNYNNYPGIGASQMANIHIVGGNISGGHIGIVEGGTITNAEVVIDGGNIFSDVNASVVKNNAGTKVDKYILTGYSPNQPVKFDSPISGAAYYNTNGVIANSKGYLSFYLPESAKKTLTDYAISEISDQEYSGDPIKPNIEVGKLVEGIDYEVYYSNNVEVGTATVVAQGTGIYTGMISRDFSIIEPIIHVDGLNFDEDDVELEIGEEYELSVTILPDNAANKNVYWESSDNTIVEVNEKGKISAKKEGNAVITVSAEDGGHQAVCQIHVKPHSLIKTDAKDATCEESGGIEYWTCENCGKIFSDENGLNEIDGSDISIPALEHSWSEEYVVDIPATCIEEGSESIHCSICGKIKEGSQTVIPKTEHTYGEWVVTKTPTCQEKGTREKTCEVCGNIIVEELPATDHIWNDDYTVDKPATHSEEGTESIHCSVCGEIREDSERIIPIVEHEFGDWVIITPATCTKDGEKVHECSDCGFKETVIIPATDHYWNSDYTVDKEPTCTEEGIESIHCSVCGEIKEGSEKTIPLIDHSYGEWKINQASSCTEDGEKERICTVCGAWEIVAIPARGHDWNTEYTVEKPATCTEEGLEAIYCAFCQDRQEGTERVIPKTNHNYGAWTTTKAASYTAKGTKEHVCTVCGHKEQAEIPMLTRTSIANASVSNVVEKTYTGSALTQSPVVKVGSATLKHGTDYTVAYKNNVNAGTASVIITGIGKYNGSKTVTFKITKLTGWHKQGGYWYFYDNNGKMVKSAWKQDSKGWCYLGNDGRMVTNGWAKDSKGWAWMNGNGYWDSSTKWIQYNGAWYYIEKGYRVANSWRQDSKGWCYLGADGKMVTNGWVKDSKGWCWLGSDGYWVKNKWVKDGGVWYYLKPDGYMASNEWVKSGGYWYYMKSSGAMAADEWIYSSGYWYYMKSNGIMASNEWIKSGGYWYYLKSGGIMASNEWVKSGAYWYYMKSSGVMATGIQTISGKTYKFDSSGRWVS